MRLVVLFASLVLALPASAAEPAPEPSTPRPAALVADQVPDVPQSVVDDTLPYMEFRTASFVAWDPKDRSMLVSTRFADTDQLHRVAKPMANREQLTFANEPVRSASFSPDGSMLLYEKDSGGNEVNQIYALDKGKSRLISDGTSRHAIGPWSHDGKMLALGSNRRTGVYNDIYVTNPRGQGAEPTMLLASDGGGWFALDFSPDDRQLLVFNYVSVSQNQLHLITLDTGTIRQLTDATKPVAYSSLAFAPDGTLWAASDDGADLRRLGTINLETGAFMPMIDEAVTGGEIDGFKMSQDGRYVAYEVNLAGRSVLRIYDRKDSSIRTVEGLGTGVIGAMDFAPWGELGLTFASNTAGTDVYSVDPATLTVTRWTRSETGGLDTAVNVTPELVSVESFDGEKVTGYLYRPNPARFKGKRPMIISIHGGPEGQYRPGFLGRNNYLLNDMGVALFYPNVRGSTGFGKRFVGLDNGPWKREDSVKDIGAFLNHFRADKGIDRRRIGVTGGSYGGYMTLASMLAYRDKIKAGLEIVGISNFVTFLENTESYRRDLRRTEYGDERDPEQRKKLEEISPLARASDIRMPLMVVTGANDPRVPASEADQLIAAVRQSGGTAWHLLAKNEGHGFRKKANADYQFWTSLLFWQKYLLD